MKMDTMPFALFLLLPVVMGTKEFSVHVCTTRTVHSNEQEPSVLHLTCTEGLIYVQKAVYGQSKGKLCKYSNTDTCIKNALYAEQLVTCLGKSRCTVPATPVHLDRCDQDSDYLQVDYQCITGYRFDVCGYNRPQSEQARNGDNAHTVPLVPVGHIMSSNFPEPYPGALMCECMVTAAISSNTRIEFELLDFHLEASPRCIYDYAELLVGDNERGPEEERMCGGVQRRTRKTIESTWAKVRFRANDYQEYRGFWIKVWATSGDNPQVPVTIVCQNQIHLPYTLSPPAVQQAEPASLPASGATGGEKGSEKRNVWRGTLPPESASGQVTPVNSLAKELSVSRNTGIIIGVCVSGLFAMIIINIVGFIICRHNMNKHGKQSPTSSGQGTNSSDSFSSLETEYVSLNSNGASYHSGLCDANLYTTHVRTKSGCRLAGSIPTYDTGVVIERTPGVEHTMKASDYDYGMLPETYTRKSHVGPHTGVPYVISQVGDHQSSHEKCGRAEEGEEEEEDPYAVLRYNRTTPRTADAHEGSYATIGRRHSVRHATYRDYADYDEIEDYPQCSTDNGKELSSSQNCHKHSDDTAGQTWRKSLWAQPEGPTDKQKDCTVGLNHRDSVRGSRRARHPNIEVPVVVIDSVNSGDNLCRGEVHDSLGRGREDHGETETYAASEVSTNSEYL